MSKFLDPTTILQAMPLVVLVVLIFVAGSNRGDTDQPLPTATPTAIVTPIATVVVTDMTPTPFVLECVDLYPEDRNENRRYYCNRAN